MLLIRHSSSGLTKMQPGTTSTITMPLWMTMHTYTWWVQVCTVLHFVLTYRFYSGQWTSQMCWLSCWSLRTPQYQPVLQVQLVQHPSGPWNSIFRWLWFAYIYSGNCFCMCDGELSNISLWSTLFMPPTTSFRLDLVLKNGPLDNGSTWSSQSPHGRKSISSTSMHWRI